MGVINVSPESFYKGSVTTQIDAIRRCAESMVVDGAAIIDVGAMSTAPYLSTQISLEEEILRLESAVRVINDTVHLPISVDTTRAEAAESAIKMGAKIINDVTGLKGDPQMAKIIAEYDVSTILMAHDSKDSRDDPITRIKAALAESLTLSHTAGIDDEKIVVDPGLGFFRKEGKGIGFSPTKDLPWYAWDCTVIRELSKLRDLGRPLCVSASRKSFIGKILGHDRPEERLIGSLAAAAIATFNGAHLIRTHDVRESVEAVKMAENIRRLGI
jgi:dihydropteroate synthase